MRVTALALEDVRSYATVDLVLARGITAFIGPNGAGKTNLLEAIHLAARGDSPRAHDDTELVRWGTNTGRVRVDVELLGAAPSARRRYLDAMLAQIERAHRRETREFQRVVEQRNALLRAARDELALPEDEMAFWDRELVRLASSISLRRALLVAELVEPFRAATARF